MGIRLIIVDDHELVRHGLRAAIGRSNEIEIVAEAFDGIASIAKSLEFKPDVVLMDIRMPKKDGIESTKEIKDKLPNTRVLMFTSNDSKEDIFAALAAGADGYCLKDTNAKELILAIQTVHAGATWLDPQIAQLVLRAVSSPATSSPSFTILETQTFDLSPREIEILRLLVEGLSNSEMAERLVISPQTVKTHMKHVMEKLQVSDRTKAAVKAMREGLV
jgi:DNA-binding NarL/FixJ family response regulator